MKTGQTKSAKVNSSFAFILTKRGYGGYVQIWKQFSCKLTNDGSNNLSGIQPVKSLQCLSGVFDSGSVSFKLLGVSYLNGV